MCPILHRIDAAALETDLPKRVEYITKFIEFGPDDAAALRAAAPIVKQITNEAVDAVYEKLFSFDVTRTVFLSRNTGFEGKLAERLEEITHENEQIKFRKDFLRAWMFKVFTADYNDIKTFEYLDKVGLMHTGPAAFSHREKKEPLHVDYTHCALLLGHVHTILTKAVLARNLPTETTAATLAAINKVLWIQNDLFARHYIPPTHSVCPVSKQEAKPAWGWGLFGRAA
ncbi:protoglobin protein [Ceratobasidium sp. AG-Ba]|nr:protoglobin protein [Ceratobasidium sp. AG-Ba]QRW07399.1 protoglobin protein [Ceratobasidium sp. AG-Ba]